MDPKSKPSMDEGAGLEEGEAAPQVERHGERVSVSAPHLFATMLLVSLVRHSKAVGWHKDMPPPDGDTKESQ